MQQEFAELQVTIFSAANDFPIRKSLPQNLQILLQVCSNAEMYKSENGIILQFCRFGMHVCIDPIDVRVDFEFYLGKLAYVHYLFYIWPTGATLPLLKILIFIIHEAMASL